MAYFDSSRNRQIVSLLINAIFHLSKCQKQKKVVAVVDAARWHKKCKKINRKIRQIVIYI